MRAGSIKIKRYKTRKKGWGWVILMALLLLSYGLWRWQQAGFPLPLSQSLSPAPTLSPEQARTEEKTLILPGQSWYALQLGIFDLEASARSMAAGFQARGAGGFIDDREKYRVLAAAYENRADAQAVQQQLKALHNVEAYILPLQSPELTLQLSGQKAQLTALSDALDALHQTATLLSHLSLSLDRREINQETLRSALSSQQETLSSLEKRLHQLFGENPHTAVQPILSTLEELTVSLATARQAQGETRLGAQVKYCQLLCIVRLSQYAAELSSPQ